MEIEQLVNVAIVVGLSIYAVAKEAPSTSKITRLIGLGMALVFAQFVFNKVFAIDSIRMGPTIAQDILLLKKFDFENSLVVLGYSLIVSGLLVYVKSFFFADAEETLDAIDEGQAAEEEKKGSSGKES